MPLEPTSFLNLVSQFIPRTPPIYASGVLGLQAGYQAHLVFTGMLES